MRLFRPLLPFLAARAAAACATPPPQAVDNVIAFGDSYTDEGRLSAYFARNGSAPEPGTHTSGSNFTASGGHAWGHFATQALGAKYYDYAGEYHVPSLCPPRRLMQNSKRRGRVGRGGARA